MNGYLKRIREAAQKAVDTARTGPKDALKNVTEGMLRRASAAGVPAEAVGAGSTAAARLWTRLSPDDPLAHARLGEALVRDGQPADAIEVLRRGAAADTEAALLAEAWLARAELQTGDIGQAVGRIERVILRLPSRDPSLEAQIRGALCAAALDAYRPDLAERALGTTGDDPLRALCRARLALIGGDLDEAKAQASHASAAGLPEEATVWLGVAQALSGDRRGATSMLEGSHTKGPDRAFADATLGWVHVLAGADGAEARLKAAVERLPTHAGAMLLLGVLAERSGDHGAARQWYTQATEISPDWGEPWVGVVRTAVAAGDPAAAAQAAARAGGGSEHRLLAGLASAMVGEMKAAEESWQQVLEASGGDRETTREVAVLRGAVALRLASDGRPREAAEAWQAVAKRASQAGPSRLQLSRWALDSARRALDAPQPAYYAAEAALGAAAALRPGSEDLVVSHCSATFLARGPAAARSALERAIGRGATDERVLGLLGLIDAATRGTPMPEVPMPKASAALDAGKRAREGDAEGSLRLLDAAMASSPPPAVRAVVGGARALARLAQVLEMLRQGRFGEAMEVMSAALDHLPDGVDRDRVLHDLAAVTTVAARRLDAPSRARGEPPPEEAVLLWQKALRHWVELGAASAYWADLSRQVLELDDPRLSPHDVDALRARVHAVAAGLPAASAAEALVAGQPLRARAFISLLLGAPIGDEARREALGEALRPLTDEASSISTKTREDATGASPKDLMAAWQSTLARVHELQGRLADAAPDGVDAASDARDDMALGLVAMFENLHDRAGELRAARAALSEAAAVAGSEGLRAELEGKLARMEGRR